MYLALIYPLSIVTSTVIDSINYNKHHNLMSCSCDTQFYSYTSHSSLGGFESEGFLNQSLFPVFVFFFPPVPHRVLQNKAH